jgi:hypothetical protein
MTYPTTFGTIPDQQTLGNQYINVYPTLAALALEQGVIQAGAIVAVQNPVFTLYQAASQIPANGQYGTSSTSSTQYSNGGLVTYWIQVTSGSVQSNPAQTPMTARAAALSLAAYNGTGTGTLTATTNGALGSVDGVSVVVGDQIFIPAGLTNVTAVDSGPWVVENLGATAAKYVLVRPSWWFTGNKWTAGQRISVGGEGALYGNTIWRATAASGVIDTTDSAFYVERLTFQRKLVAGTLALAAGQPTLAATSATFPAGIYSATKSNILCSLAIASGTLTGTVSYGPNNSSATVFATVGYSGTAAAAVFALATAQATQTSDTSTLNVTLINF